MDIYIDVGSHKGSYVDLIYKNFNLKKILMFEPQKNIYKFIKKNILKKRNKDLQFCFI